MTPIRFPVGLLATVLALGWSFRSARAELDLEYSYCAGNALPEIRISNCTAVIESGNVSEQARRTSFANRGQAYQSEGKLDNAIADYSQAIRIDPQYAYAYANRGSAFQQKGDFNSATDDYNRAITLNPQNEFAYRNLGQLYVSKAAREENDELVNKLLDQAIYY